MQQIQQLTANCSRARSIAAAAASAACLTSLWHEQLLPQFTCRLRSQRCLPLTSSTSPGTAGPRRQPGRRQSCTCGQTCGGRARYLDRSCYQVGQGYGSSNRAAAAAAPAATAGSHKRRRNQLLLLPCSTQHHESTAAQPPRPSFPCTPSPPLCPPVGAYRLVQLHVGPADVVCRLHRIRIQLLYLLALQLIRHEGEQRTAQHADSIMPTWLGKCVGRGDSTAGGAAASSVLAGWKPCQEAAFLQPCCPCALHCC